MTKPLFSIIIATYNSREVLERCLQSIEKQTCRDFELIIIDGGSTDQTVGIIKSYSSIVTKWISEKDSGIYDAWNKGVKLAGGEWITFLGSDDSFYESALADYKNFIGLQGASELEYVSSKLHLVNQNGKVIKTLGLPWDNKTSRLINVIAHPGSLHHKSLFENYGLFNTAYKICGDYELLLRPGERFKTAFLDMVTVRMAQGGVSFNGAKLFKEHYQAVVNTGKLNLAVAKYYYYLQLAKHYVKAGIRKFGVDI